MAPWWLQINMLQFWQERISGLGFKARSIWVRSPYPVAEIPRHQSLIFVVQRRIRKIHRLQHFLTQKSRPSLGIGLCSSSCLSFLPMAFAIISLFLKLVGRKFINLLNYKGLFSVMLLLYKIKKILGTDVLILFLS